MPEKDGALKKWWNTLIIVIAAIAIISFAVRNFNAFVYVLTVVIGFGAVIMIHEFGHFLVAKLSGIRVEAFSIGFPPTLLGIRKTGRGFRVRFLPGLFGEPEKKTEEQDNDNSSLTSQAVDKLSSKKVPAESETEYRIGLIPFGGFVKMLGQEDVGTADATDDPRSFANKPLLVRIAVVAAGVVFNAISAVLIFMVVFLIGVDLPPAVVGTVVPNSPAQLAGLRAGDRVVEVNGETFVDFTSLPLAGALSAEGEAASFVVERPDGTREQFDIIASQSPGADLRTFGIGQAETLTIAEFSDPEDIAKLYDTTALRPGDVVAAFDGRTVENIHQLRKLVKNSLQPEGVLTVERTDAQSDQKTMVDVKVPLYLNHANSDFETGYELAHIYTMVPRLKIMSVPDKARPPSFKDKLISLWRQKILRKQPPDQTAPSLEVGDIIVKIADTDNPTFEELRNITIRHKDRPMPINVLRQIPDGSEETITVTTTPRRIPGSDPNHVTIGIFPSFDAEHPVVAKTISVENGPEPLKIPTGATIVAVDGEEVASFYDIMRIIRRNRGHRVSIEYRIGNDGGVVGLNIPVDDDFITAEADFAPPVPDSFVSTAYVPFDLLKESYQADSAGLAIKMGLKKTYMFIAQTYVTLRRLISRDVSPKTLVGPVGIVTMSYKIVASQSLTYYAYFLGLISSVIAVMNLLPLPVVDGGVIVFMIVEKIKGSPISVKTQEIIAYVGLALILALFLWLTYNDINRLFR
ncbi:MAG: M50 family metallopeptidase [Planctomycetota bacterium]|jgi:regulator of sigma E protease